MIEAVRADLPPGRLLELAVADLAVIDRLRLRLAPGLNVFSGETGAGKSLLIDALGLVLGARSDSSLVRHGADAARVEALFDRLPEPLICVREVSASGRSTARLDDETRTHLLPKVEGLALTIEVRVGEQGKLFGSVTARDIAEALQQATAIEVEHRQVDLREPIREVGSRDVTVKLTRNVQATVTVNVEPLGGLPAAEEAPAAEVPAAEAVPETTEAAEEAPALDIIEEAAGVEAETEAGEESEAEEETEPEDE